MSEGLIVLIAGALLASTVVASRLAQRLRLPALVLFLAIGMAIGSDGAGWIRFDDYELARQIGTLSLALILFEGGLSTNWEELRAVLRPAIALALGGTVVTAVLTGVAGMALLGLAPLSGLLLGSILSSTDGAAVFGILRGSPLPRRIAGTLEGEAGLNDPVAVLLVTGFTLWIEKPGYGLLDMACLFVVQLGVGALAGIVVGRGAAALMAGLRLPTAGLYPVGTLATAAIAYGAANSLGGSGFEAVYLAGLVLGGSAIPAQVTIAIFHQGAAWLAQAALFLTLGLLVFPGRLYAVWLPGTALALFVMVVARPVAVLLSTAVERFTPAEVAVLSWAGLRGGVPVVLATLPVIAGVPESERFFDVVFFVVVISTLLQGMSFERVARSLGVIGADRQRRRRAPRPAPMARAWSAHDGDPDNPVRVDDAPVVEHLLLRPDAPGALVMLQDGRLAITGATLAVGAARRLRGYAEVRARRAQDGFERAWWDEVAAALG